MAPVLEKDLSSYPRSLNETNSDGRNIYQTKEKAPACPSAFEFGNSTTEDCLYIDLFVPRKAIEEKLALDIFLYFHGGAFLAGTNVVVGPDRGAFIGDISDDLIFVNFLQLRSRISSSCQQTIDSAFSDLCFQTVSRTELRRSTAFNITIICLYLATKDLWTSKWQ